LKPRKNAKAPRPKNAGPTTRELEAKKRLYEPSHRELIVRMALDARAKYIWPAWDLGRSALAP
jgi:hypothetical protein